MHTPPVTTTFHLHLPLAPASSYPVPLLMSAGIFLAWVPIFFLLTVVTSWSWQMKAHQVAVHWVCWCAEMGSWWDAGSSRNELIFWCASSSAADFVIFISRIVMQCSASATHLRKTPPSAPSLITKQLKRRERQADRQTRWTQRMTLWSALHPPVLPSWCSCLYFASLSCFEPL